MKGYESIVDALAAIKNATSASDVNWVIGGSAGLMLRGLPLADPPRDLDLYCDDEDVAELFRQLKSYAIDEPNVSCTDIYRSRLVHFSIHHVAVELVGGFRVTAFGSRYDVDVNNILIPYGDRIELPGLPIAVRVVPLAHELLFNVLRGRQDRVSTIIDEYVKEPERHSAAMNRLMESNLISPEVEQFVSRLINEKRAGDGK